MRLMYDGISSLAAGIAREFPNAALVAGYVNGKFTWAEQDWNLFPHANRVQITVTASVNAGDVLDVEAGDATPGQTAGWIAMRKAAGLWRPTIYCSRSVIPAVRAGTGKFVLGRDYDIWVADYTGLAHQVTAPGLPAASCAATQYQSTARWDVSAVYDDGWPHRTAPAAPKLPAPGGQSGTPYVTVNLGWTPVAGARAYRVQVAAGTPDSVGRVVASVDTTSVHVQGLEVGAPHPLVMRVQAAGGAWSRWTVVER